MGVAAAPVAARHITTPVCQPVTRRQCRTVPVQTPRTVETPVCVNVPKCTSVPKCVAVPNCVSVPKCINVPKGVAVPKCSTTEQCVTDQACLQPGAKGGPQNYLQPSPQDHLHRSH